MAAAPAASPVARPGAGARGLLFGSTAYLLWGVLPAYWPHLKPAGSLEILAHRMVWSLAVAVLIVTVTRRWAGVRAVLADRRAVTLLTAGAVLVGVNWGTFIWAVNHDRVVETSLGYFVNPLFTIFLAVVVLGERLRRAQWVALSFGGAAIALIAIDYGHPPWVAVSLAGSMGCYGLIKKSVGVPAHTGFVVETAVLCVPALGYLLALHATGRSTFGSHGAGHALLLTSTGVVTAVPLLLFSAAAGMLPLTTLGLLQYLAPILQLIFGVTIFAEPLPVVELIGFGLVWVAIGILTADMLRRPRTALTRRSPEPAALS